MSEYRVEHKCATPLRFGKALRVIKRLSTKAQHTQPETKMVVSFYLAVLHEKWDISNISNTQRDAFNEKCPFCIECICASIVKNDICIKVIQDTTPQHIKDFVFGLSNKD